VRSPAATLHSPTHKLPAPLSPKESDKLVGNQTLTPNPVQEEIKLLVLAGLLTLRDVDSYWFSIPEIGVFLKCFLKGRQELLDFLKRQKYNESLLSLLQKKKIKSSSLGNMFHIRDLLGSGLVEKYDLFC